METTQMSNLPVAETILEQLGGRKFVAMTGARNFIGCATYLAFKLPGAGGFTKSGINYVKVTLDPDDTYTMTFQRIYTAKGFPRTKDIAQHHGVYCDMLQEVFTRETGLAVSL
jgi:hypothetical protein